MNFLGKYHTSIDTCPVGPFQKVLSGEPLKNIHIGGRYREKAAFNCWRKLFNDYLKEFGLPTNYELFLNKMAKASEFWAKRGVSQLIVSRNRNVNSLSE